MIYIHIPFCQKRCIYCDFYSTTCGEPVRRRFTEALCRELEARAAYLPPGEVGSVYVGGGTPSQLSQEELARIMRCVRGNYHLSADAELTFEANPDDVTPQMAEGLKELGFNRVSLGVQTFDDNLLQVLQRRHTAGQARQAVATLTATGITNLSIDLIYGLPLQSVADFKRDLEQAFELPVKHLSAYALSVEKGTALSRKVASGELVPADEDTCAAEYEALACAAEKAGFEHYEISNFGLPGFHSRHNSGYWDGTPYLGCGPGAHSFDGTARRYNLPDLAAYLGSPDNPPHETERLTREERFDELVFTSLRTARGLSLKQMECTYGHAWLDALMHAARPHLEAGRLETAGSRLRLTRAGIFVSDGIMSDLMRA